MKVSEFIEWLKTQDQEAKVEVLVHRSGNGYYDQGGNTYVYDFNPLDTEHFEYNNFPTLNVRDLRIGTMDNH